MAAATPVRGTVMADETGRSNGSYLTYREFTRFEDAYKQDRGRMENTLERQEAAMAELLETLGPIAAHYKAQSETRKDIKGQFRTHIFTIIASVITALILLYVYARIGNPQAPTPPTPTPTHIQTRTQR